MCLSHSSHLKIDYDGMFTLGKPSSNTVGKYGLDLDTNTFGELRNKVACLGKLTNKKNGVFCLQVETIL